MQAAAGIGVGVLVVWLRAIRCSNPESLPPPDPVRHPFYGALYPENRSLPLLAAHVGYFGLMFLVLRWWRICRARRQTRFAVPAVLATAFWGFVLLFLLPTAEERQAAFAAVVLTSAVVQLASPWRGPPEEAPPRRLRLRYA